MRFRARKWMRKMVFSPTILRTTFGNLERRQRCIGRTGGVGYLASHTTSVYHQFVRVLSFQSYHINHDMEQKRASKCLSQRCKKGLSQIRLEVGCVFGFRRELEIKEMHVVVHKWQNAKTVRSVCHQFGSGSVECYFVVARSWCLFVVHAGSSFWLRFVWRQT